MTSRTFIPHRATPKFATAAPGAFAAPALAALLTALLGTCAPGAAADTAPALVQQEKRLFQRAERAWEISWARYFRPETNLFYDWASSTDPATSQAHLPAIEEINRQYPNPCGWGTGMEDSAISAGVWLATICDRHETTGEPRMKQRADQVWAGMALLMEASRAPGFLPRSVSPHDGRSHYIDSSRDQYTHYCHGLWRFHHSTLADAAQRAAMRRIIDAICTRMDEYVVPGARNLSICREDGVPGIVDKMWDVAPHEWARLPMIYLIGWDLTGNKHWRDQYRRYAWDAARRSLDAPLSFRTPYAHQQAVFSMEPLVALEHQAPDLRSAWLRAMNFYADRMERFSWQCLDHKPINRTGLQMDWRRRTTQTPRPGYVVPKTPDPIVQEQRTIREPAEALLSQMLVPDRPLPQDQLELLRHQLLHADFDKCVSYGLFYSVAAYWRAVKRGLIRLPADAPGAAGGAGSTIDIGTRRELFADRYLIDRLANVRLTLHHPRDEGEVLRFDRPWEGPFSGYATVIRDGALFRLYYRGKPSLTPDGVNETTCYAESRDGIRWTRPRLGLHGVAGSKDNNVILAEAPMTHNFSPFLDARPGVPASQRFKALGGTMHRNPNGGLTAFVSGDGVHWTKLVPDPVLTKGAFDSQNVAFYSEAEQCYVAYFRTFTAGVSTATQWRLDGLRTVARAVSQDFIHWTDPQPMVFDPPQTEHIYINQTHPYFRAPHLYVGLAARFMQSRPALSLEQGAALHADPAYLRIARDCSDAVLLTSRGGTRYDRTFREAFLRPGLRPQQWVSRSNYPALNVVQTGPTEMSCYVNVDTAQPGAHLRRYTWRLDGFASARASADGGELLTRTLTFGGRRLLLNFSSGAAGGIRVEIQDANGAALPGVSLDACVELIGDEIERPVTWLTGADLSKVAGQPVRIRFALREADLFSLRFAP